MDVIRLECAFSEYPGESFGFDRRTGLFCYFPVICWRSQCQTGSRESEQNHRNPFGTSNPDHLPEITGCHTLIDLPEKVVPTVTEQKQGRFFPVKNFRQPLQTGFRYLPRDSGIYDPPPAEFLQN